MFQLGAAQLAGRVKAAATRLLVQEKRYATTLVLADGGAVTSAATCQTVTAAGQLGNDKLTLLSVGGGGVSESVPVGTTKLIHVVSGDAVVVPETVAAAVQAAVAADADITHIISASSKYGSTILPRVAALLDCSPVTEVVQIISPDTFVRPMYAGNVLCKVQMTDAKKVVTIRPTAFEKAALQETSSAVTVESWDSLEPFAGSTFVAAHVSSDGAASARPDLGAATTVVAGGRGMGSTENFGLLSDLADALGGSTTALGASRAAVDAGMAPNDWQVGQTGKVVAPNLYIAVGISGAIQHLSGMKDSKTIVAINKDAEAPIFSVADYGLVADLFVAVPELTQKLKQ